RTFGAKGNEPKLTAISFGDNQIIRYTPMGSSSSKGSSSSSSRDSPKGSSTSSLKDSSKKSLKKSKKGPKSYCPDECEGLVCRCEDKNWYQVIKKKLDALNNDEYKSLLQNLEIESQHDLIYLFGDKDLFLKKFLTIQAERHEKLLEEMKSEVRQLRDFQQYHQEITEDSYSNIWKNMLEYRGQSKKYNIYLFIEKLGNFDNNVCKKIGNFFYRYGAFHVGLEIDGIVVEWGCGLAGSSIVYPRPDSRRMLAYVRLNYEKIDPVSNSKESLSNSKGLISATTLTTIGATAVTTIGATIAIGAAAVTPIPLFCAITLLIFGLCYSYKVIYYLGEINKNRLHLLAEKCVYYNKTHYYSPLKPNCQDFVDEMLGSLGIKFNPKGEFLEFMGRIKNGDASFQLGTTFESRKVFDNYVDAHWDGIKNEWDKKLLICYSDVMDSLYQRGEDAWVL
ncbi:10581_t:CDS:2, partial [Racocetra fulgida]